MTKICSKCGEELPLDCFYKRKAGRDKLKSACKDCLDAQQRRWREANPEKGAFYTAKQRKKNTENISACIKRCRINNPESVARYRVNYLGSEGYAKDLIGRLSGLENAPPELIEAKRTYLKMVRALKEKQQ